MGVNELQVIAEKVMEVAKSIDNDVEKLPDRRGGETHVIPFHPRFLPTFKYESLKIYKVNARHISVRFFTNIYDNLIVLLPDLGIIKSIRYKGKDNLPMEPFAVGKLVIEKGGTRLGEELIGSFITYGNINNADTINPLQSQKFFFAILNMIRPSARVKMYNGGTKAFIFPSPMSLTCLKYGSDTIYQVPGSSITLINYRKAISKKVTILGESVDCLEAPAYFISCKFSQQEDNLAPKCKPLGPFTSFTPVVKGLTDELVEYAEKRSPTLTNLLGILIFGSGLVCPCSNSSSNRSCYLLALSPGVPYIPELEVISLLAEPVTVSWKSEVQSFHFQLYLRVNNEYVKSFTSKVAGTLNYLCVRFNAVDEVRRLNPVINSIKNTFLWEDQDYIYMLAPPLLMYSVDCVKGIERKLSSKHIYPLLDPELRNMMPRLPLANTWLSILSNVRNIVNNHPLGVII